jgi:serine/threonine protein kinase
MPSLTGQSLGRYHILEQLGEGGMATVYKAYDTRLERDVAVKIIRKSAFSAEVLERMLKRFEREAKALARLTHPNIVGVMDYGEYEGSPYLVMPYFPGGTLKQYLGKSVPWQDAASLLLPIARALQFAHEQGIIHRDVKPSNILITLSGEPMLSDFGIAKILESEETTTLTGTGVGVGTPDYMAAEQWTGKASLQSDIYSLGVVFYELVTGRKPYVADTPAAILLKQATEPLPRPAQFVPGLPEVVEKILIKALARKPEDRFADMKTFTKAFEYLAGGGGEKLSSQPFPVQSHTSRKESQKVPLGVAVSEASTSGGRTQDDSRATILQNETRATVFQETNREKVGQIPTPLSKIRTEQTTGSRGKPRAEGRGWIGWAAWIGFACLLFGVGGVVILYSIKPAASQAPTEAPTSSLPAAPAAPVVQPITVPTNVQVINIPTLTPTHSPTPEGIIALEMCSDSYDENCVSAFGDVSGKLMISIRIARVSSSGYYILINNAPNFKYICQTLSSGRYYCVGPQIAPGTKIALVIHDSTVNQIVAKGNFTMPDLVPTPTPDHERGYP